MNLVNYLDEIRLKIASKFNEFEDYFIVDSMLFYPPISSD
tara:strand:- start:1141 stop:1260 length:120 start_codon:yes stop_codon:yes gene_type:complete